MGRTHPSTPDQRVHWASQMRVHAHEYGFVTNLSRTIGVARPTLYAWKMQAYQALERTFLDTTVTSVLTPALERQILTLLVEGHNRYSNIQTCLLRLTGQRVRIGSIAAVVQEAQQRALDWMASHAPATTRRWRWMKSMPPIAVAPLSTWLTRSVGRSGRPKGRWRSTARVGRCYCGSRRSAACAGTPPSAMALRPSRRRVRSSIPTGSTAVMFGTSSIPGASFSSAWSGT
jgi:hypothetical protein